MGILYFLVIFTPEKICGLLRFGLLIEAARVVYFCYCATFMVCPICIVYTGIICIYFGWYVKYTVYHEVDIRIVTGIFLFVKKMIEKSMSA